MRTVRSTARTINLRKGGGSWGYLSHLSLPSASLRDEALSQLKRFSCKEKATSALSSNSQQKKLS